MVVYMEKKLLLNLSDQQLFDVLINYKKYKYEDVVCEYAKEILIERGYKKDELSKIAENKSKSTAPLKKELNECFIRLKKLYLLEIISILFFFVLAILDSLFQNLFQKFLFIFLIIDLISLITVYWLILIQLLRFDDLYDKYLSIPSSRLNIILYFFFGFIIMCFGYFEKKAIIKEINS